MIGAFHQPRCVVADTDTLNTLDDRQLSAGIAEVIKYGLIRDLSFFEWLEKNMQQLLTRDPLALAYAIERSCQNKADVVAEDEKEGGIRAILNLGHTFGHAIEAATGYGKWLHGEAVGTGMLMAADMSKRMGKLTDDDVQRVDNIIDGARLPTRTPVGMDYEKFMKYMTVDKKVEAGAIRLVLLESIGKAFIASEYDDALLRQTIDAHHAST
jgi:3-dehydroquinate synthase